MNISGTESAQADATKQGENGFETGFDVRKAASMLDSIAARWDDAHKDHVQVMRALARLTSRTENMERGFTQVEIAEEVLKEGPSSWHGLNDPDDIRRRINGAWKKLEKEWDKHITGIRQRFEEAGLDHLPRTPEKKPGGGRGNTSLYRLTFAPRSELSVQELPSINPPPSWDGSIRYYLDELSEARLLRWLANDGLVLSGWRAKAFGGTLGLLFIALAIVFGGSVLGLTLATTVQALTKGLLAVGVIGISSWLLVRPIYRLVHDRIAQAPMWLQGDSTFEDRLLEIQQSEELGCNIIRLTRYTADCPICGAKVRVQPGRREFHRRLVGRCARAPVEHVFSFDHITRRGMSLRHF
ncbi:MAG: hypothetical protein AB1344_10930 [Pseudomonadota bacterium]